MCHGLGRGATDVYSCGGVFVSVFVRDGVLPSGNEAATGRFSDTCPTFLIEPPGVVKCLVGTGQLRGTIVGCVSRRQRFSTLARRCLFFISWFPATLRFRTCVSASFACFTNRRDKNCDTHLFRSIFLSFFRQEVPTNKRLFARSLPLLLLLYIRILYYTLFGGWGEGTSIVLFMAFFFQGTLTVVAFASFRVDTKCAEK